MIRLFAGAAVLFAGSMLSSNAQGFGRADLFPLTLNSSWTYNKGGTVVVSKIAEQSGVRYVEITNVNTSGSLTLRVTSNEVAVAELNNSDYIMMQGDLGFSPLLQFPMSMRQSWLDRTGTSNGYRIYRNTLVTSTNVSVAIYGKVYTGCTELTVYVSFVDGYIPGHLKWGVKKFYFLPGVGCIKRFMVSEDGFSDTIVAVAWDIQVTGSALVVQTNGQGTIEPNYNGQVLEFGSNYTMVAAPASGFVFTNWTSNSLPPTGNPTNSFVMQSNLVLQANFVDVARPVAAVRTPIGGSRLSNAVATVTGKATDNSGDVAGVFCRVNDQGPWIRASGTTNWTASLDLKPGWNVVQTYAEDAAGNRSMTNQVTYTYVVSALLPVEIVGKGRISPDYNGQWLKIGKSYSAIAIPALGYRLTRWTDCTDTVRTRVSTLRFVMASNLCFRAHFVDVARPVVAVRTPIGGSRLSRRVATVTGKATDNSGDVAGVFCQVNGQGPWIRASGTTNWTVSLDLKPGLNVVRIYAEDAVGNHSATRRVTYTYVVSAPLAVEIVGKGRISPDFNDQWVQIGKACSMIATPALGYRFTHWTGCTGTVRTNVPTLRFVMASNLCFRAHFVDGARPVVALRTPIGESRLSNAVAIVTGKATDNSGDVAGVFCQVNDREPWIRASGTTNWTASLDLKPGLNVVQVYAEDAAGNRSLTNRVLYTYVVSAPLPVEIVGRGTITPDYNGRWLEIGKTYSMSANPASGYRLTHWTDCADAVLTNGLTLRFVMASNLCFRAHFADVTPPTLTVVPLPNGGKVTKPILTLSGEATDNDRVLGVHYLYKGTLWRWASGYPHWYATLYLLLPGANPVSIYAEDMSGNCSPTNTFTCTYEERILLRYWPMNGGDEWVYSNEPFHDTTARCSYGSACSNNGFAMTFATGSDAAIQFYQYAEDNTELQLFGERVAGTTLCYNPPIVVLDESLLLQDGSRTASHSTCMPGYGNIPLKVAVSASAVGTVTVPAGTYQNCKQVSYRVEGTIPGQGITTLSARSFVIAPRVGAIRYGVYEPNGIDVVFMGWQDLISGTVDHVPVGNLAGPAGAPQTVAIAGEEWAALDDMRIGSPTPPETIRPAVTIASPIPSQRLAPNPFLALKGTYYGLFYPNPQACPDQPVEVTNAGSLKMTLTDKGVASGSVVMGSRTYAFGGLALDLDGQASRQLKRTPPLAPLELALHLELADTHGVVRGHVSSTGWESELLAYRVRANTHLTGRYTFVLPGGDATEPHQPTGYGAGTITVDQQGSVRLAGWLGEGTTLSVGSGLSDEGWCPLHVPLYGDRGMVLGWAQFGTNDPTYDVVGTHLWIQAAAIGPVDQYHREGFAMHSELLGSRYVAPKTAQSAMPWTNGVVTLAGGNLSRELTNGVAWVKNRLVLSPPHTNKLVLSLTPSDGLWSGTFLHPETRWTTSLRGALLQGPGRGAGWFLGTNQSGCVLILPEP